MKVKCRIYVAASNNWEPLYLYFQEFWQSDVNSGTKDESKSYLSCIIVVINILGNRNFPTAKVMLVGNFELNP